jgi:type VI secretion system secreted protein Hcp
MAFDAFIKIDGIPGESIDSKHKDWIEILSYEQELDQPASYTASSSGGATAERVNFKPFSIVKEVDKASPKLLAACCTGRHIKEIVIELCRAGGDKQRYLEIKMEHVLVSKYRQKGGASFPLETVEFAPGRFTMTYSQQKREDGTLSGNVAAGWDLMANKSIA